MDSTSFRPPETSSPSVLHILSGDLWGGAEAQVLALLSALQRRDVNLALLLFRHGKVENRFAARGISTTVVDESQRLVPFVREVLRQGAARRPDLIVTHGYKEAALGALLAVRLGRPLIVTFHGVSEHLPGFRGAKAKLYLALERSIARYVARKVLSPTRALAEELGVANLQKLKVIPNVVEDEPPERASAPSLQKPAVLCIGRLAPVKRFDRAIEAVASLPDVHLYILGDGATRTELEAQARHLGLEHRVHFLGFRTDVQSVLVAGDVLLLTSESEGMPTVLLEAIRARKPVVTSDLPGTRELAGYFPHYPITLVSPRTPEAFADALHTVLDAAQYAEATGSASDTVMRHFHPDYAALSHVTLYRELLGREVTTP